MKTLLAFTVFFSSLYVQAQNFPTHMKCMSVLNTELTAHEVKINEYAMAFISYTKDSEWKMDADVIENKINSLRLEHLPTGAVATAHSLVYPFNHLATSLEIKNKKATVDCSLSYKTSEQ